jgi:hypothetical protein
MNKKDLQLLQEESEKVVGNKLAAFKQYKEVADKTVEVERIVDEWNKRINTLSNAINAMDGYISTPEFQNFYDEWIRSRKYENISKYLTVDNSDMLVAHMEDIASLDNIKDILEVLTP